MVEVEVEVEVIPRRKDWGREWALSSRSLR